MQSQNDCEGLSNAIESLGIECETLNMAAFGTKSAMLPADCCVLLPEVAIMTRTDSAIRNIQIDIVRRVLEKHRPIQFVSAPGVLDGSDVSSVGRRIYVANNMMRVDMPGIDSFRQIVTAFGYEVILLSIAKTHRLSEVCSFVPPNFVLLNPAWISPEAFEGFAVINVDTTEPKAASTLTVGATTFISKAYSKTARQLHEIGINVQLVDISVIEAAGGCLGRLALVKGPRFPKRSHKTQERD